MFEYIGYIITFWNNEFLYDMLRVPVPLAEKFARPFIVYVFLVALLRVFGKRELAQLNPFDLVVLLSLSNTVQNAIIGEDNSVTGGLVGAFALCAINYLVIRFLFKHRGLHQLVEGSPEVLVEKGRICPKALARELMTEMDLLTMAHRQGFAHIAEIEECVLEPGGTIYMKGKEPRVAERHHAEVMMRLEHLERQIEHLRHALRHTP